MNMMGSRSSLQHLLGAQQTSLKGSFEMDHEFFLWPKANLLKSKTV